MPTLRDIKGFDNFDFRLIRANHPWAIALLLITTMHYSNPKLIVAIFKTETLAIP